MRRPIVTLLIRYVAVPLIVVTFAVVLIILNSGFIGAAVPLVLKKLNIDPALATGPIVTTSNDVLSLLIYLGLVTLFLHLTN